MLMRLTACSAFAGLLMMAGMAVAACDAKLPKLVQGMPYSEARKLLLESGWQGQMMYPPPEEGSSVGTAYHEWGFTEVTECAGTGLAPCNYRYTDAFGNTLQATSQGEENPILSGWQIVTE